MRKINSLFLSLLLSSVVLTGVSCAYSPKAFESLDKTLKAYERAIRWRDFDFARALQKNPQKVSDFKRLRLKNIRVTSYKVINKIISPDLSKTEVVVDIRYYSENSAVERVITDRQTWLYDDVKDRWQLDTAFPDFQFH